MFLELNSQRDQFDSSIFHKEQSIIQLVSR